MLIFAMRTFNIWNYGMISIPWYVAILFVPLIEPELTLLAATVLAVIGILTSNRILRVACFIMAALPAAMVVFFAAYA